MNPRDWFGVVVRGLGVWTIIDGIHRFIGLLTAPYGFPSSGNVEYSLIYSVADMAIGAFLLLCADWLVQIAYRRPPSQDADVKEID